MVIDWGLVLSAVEASARAVAWIRGRSLELKCMPVIDRVKELEETEYSDVEAKLDENGLLLSDEEEMRATHCPVVQFEVSKPDNVTLFLAALHAGFIQGFLRGDGFEGTAFVCLTHKGRRAWERYCTQRRMRWRLKVFSTTALESLDSFAERRDPRTNWSGYPPEHEERRFRRRHCYRNYGHPLYYEGG